MSKMWTKAIPWVALSLLVLAIVILVILLVLDYFKPYPEPPSPLIDELLNDITLKNNWVPTGGTPVTGERGQCLLYPTFSLEAILVDGIEPIAKVDDLPPEFRCDDGFTMPLQKRTRTCYADECIGYDGGIYTKGDIEEYYIQCGNSEPCSNGRSAIVFNFNFTGAVVSPNARCMIAEGSSFWNEPCPGTIGADHFFLNVDQAVIGESSSLVRIRSPGTDKCLLPSGTSSLVTGDCLSAPDKGYVWVLTPTVCLPDEPSVCYPSQLATIPDNIDVERLEDPEYLLDLASEIHSIQINGSALKLAPYAFCDNISDNEPVGECTPRTAIISGYSYQSIF